MGEGSLTPLARSGRGAGSAALSLSKGEGGSSRASARIETQSRGFDRLNPIGFDTLHFVPLLNLRPFVTPNEAPLVSP